MTLNNANNTISFYLTCVNYQQFFLSLRYGNRFLNEQICTYMIKKILYIGLVIILFVGVPTKIYADHAIEIIDNDFDNVSISVTGSVLHITGANGQTLQIYNVAGICVMNIKVDGPDQRFEMSLPKGCYIVKVGKTVRKISIR